MPSSGWRSLASRPLQVSALVAALLWSLGLIAAATTVPVYRSVSVTTDGSTTPESQTLVGENGTHVLFIMAVPLVTTVLVAWFLFRSRHRWALPMALAFTGLLVVLNMAALLTIGIFVLPVAGALVVACLCGVSISSTPGPESVSPRDDAQP